MRRTIKYYLYGIFILLSLISGSKTVKAQSPSDLRLNEILVLNDSNYIDDFGQHSPWIEIFNTAYSKIEIGGCYLTDDLNNPTKYWIPTGDPATVIHPRNYIVFWADNMPTRGIFHLNFDLKDAKTIALFDASGKTLIDKVDIPTGIKPDITYGKPNTSSNEWVFLDKSTPKANNDYSRKESAGDNFIKFDPYGIGMTMIAMFVVFSALAFLFIIFKELGRFFIRKGNNAIKLSMTENKATGTTVARGEMSGEVNAAIAMAIYLYQSEMHDEENTVLTIRKVSKNYSPWSSKIYTLRNSPR